MLHRLAAVEECRRHLLCRSWIDWLRATGGRRPLVLDFRLPASATWELRLSLSLLLLLALPGSSHRRGERQTHPSMRWHSGMLGQRRHRLAPHCHRFPSHLHQPMTSLLLRLCLVLHP